MSEGQLIVNEVSQKDSRRVMKTVGVLLSAVLSKVFQQIVTSSAIVEPINETNQFTVFNEKNFIKILLTLTNFKLHNS